MKRIFGLALLTYVLFINQSGMMVAAMADDSKEAKTQDASPESKPNNDVKPSDDKTDDPEVSETLKIEGVFEATKSWKLAHRSDQIESLEIERILPHGARVTRDQTVIWFVTDAIDRQVAAAEIDLKLARLVAEDDQFDYDQFLKTQSIDREAAQRSRRQARQAYDNYVKTDREQEIESSEFELKNSQASLENVLEELEQLTQMYEADDLTEESEEIVLKRAKQAVDSAEFRLKTTQVRTQRKIDQSIPVQDATEEESLAKAELAYAKTVRDLESAKKKRDLNRQKAKAELGVKEANFKKLSEQRKSIVMKSPGDGIFLHGELTRGKLSAKPSPFEAGSKVTKDQVIATVVDPKKMNFRVELSETQLAKIRSSDVAVIKPTAAPDQTIDATIESVDDVPFAAGKLDAVLKLKGKLPEILVPAMTGSAEFKP